MIIIFLSLSVFIRSSHHYIYNFIEWTSTRLYLVITSIIRNSPSRILIQSKVGNSHPTGKPLSCPQKWTACILMSLCSHFAGGLSNKKHKYTSVLDSDLNQYCFLPKETFFMVTILNFALIIVIKRIQCLRCCQKVCRKSCQTLRKTYIKSVFLNMTTLKSVTSFSR